MSYKVIVAHYGHPLLRGAKHWSIIVLTHARELNGKVYQVEGSTNTYAVKKETGPVSLLDSATYLGSAEVGQVSKDAAFGPEPYSLHTILTGTPVVRGDITWNCQHWVISALERLRAAGHSINEVTLADLQAKLAQATREDSN